MLWIIKEQSIDLNNEQIFSIFYHFLPYEPTTAEVQQSVASWHSSEQMPQAEPQSQVYCRVIWLIANEYVR